jgi:hypothetical protein
MNRATSGSKAGMGPAVMKCMREVGLGLGLERFTLAKQGSVCCVVDIVDEDVASLTLSPLPDYPLELEAHKARQFVAAWRQHAELEPESEFAVEQEQREV